MSLPSALLLVVFLLQSPSAQPRGETPPAQKHVTFAQLTDAHVFDDGWKAEGSEPYLQALDNRAALHWAVGQINELAAKKPIDFVVYTGDFGLQNVFFTDPKCNVVPFISPPQNGPPPFTSEMAAQEFALELDRLVVHTVYVVPGNNDIIDEKVIDIPRFECFISKLQSDLQRLPGHIHVQVLRADKAVGMAGFRLAGLNTASFKNEDNYKDACKQAPPAPTKAPGMGCPGPQLQAIGRLLDGDGASPLLLFTHIPDLFDPYSNKPSWVIDTRTRADWLQQAAKPQLVGIFAGHFHSNRRDIYATDSGTQKLFIDPVDGQKTWIAPPLAGKNQRDGKPQARGFMLVSVEANQGKFLVDGTSFWYPGLVPDNEPPKTTEPTPSQTKGAAMSPLGFFELVLVVILIAGCFGGVLNFLLYRGQDSEAQAGALAGAQRSANSSLVPFLRDLVLGVGAAFLVPVFLNVIGSDLVSTMHHGPDNQPDYSKVLVFAGFCLVASMSAKSFIRSVSERVLRKAEEAEKLAGEAKKDASEAQITLQRLSETLVEKDEPEASPSAGQEEPLPDGIKRRILKALTTPPHILRTTTGIAHDADSRAEETDVALKELQTKGLADTVLIAGSDGKNRSYWRITSRGVAALARNPERILTT